MSGFNYCSLTWIQVSQETSKVVWYSHLFKNFPEFVVIYTVKGFSIVNKADVFLEFLCFFHDSVNVGNLISGFSAFSKPSLYIWKFLGHKMLKPMLKDFECKLISMWNECNYTVVWTFFGLHPGLCVAGEEKTHRDTVRKALEISSLPLTLLDFQESQGKYKILCDPIQTWLWIASFPPFPHYTLQTFLVWSQKDPKLFCPSDIFTHWLQLCPTLWDLMDCACQAPLSVEFPRQEYWSGLPSPPPGDLPNPENEPTSLGSSALAGGFFTTVPLAKPNSHSPFWLLGLKFSRSEIPLDSEGSF